MIVPKNRYVRGVAPKTETEGRMRLPEDEVDEDSFEGVEEDGDDEEEASKGFEGVVSLSLS
jgi:hypothetical protein